MLRVSGFCVGQCGPIIRPRPGRNNDCVPTGVLQRPEWVYLQHWMEEQLDVVKQEDLAPRLRHQLSDQSLCLKGALASGHAEHLAADLLAQEAAWEAAFLGDSGQKLSLSDAMSAHQEHQPEVAGSGLRNCAQEIVSRSASLPGVRSEARIATYTVGTASQCGPDTMVLRAIRRDGGSDLSGLHVAGAGRYGSNRTIRCCESPPSPTLGVSLYQLTKFRQTQEGTQEAWPEGDNSPTGRPPVGLASPKGSGWQEPLVFAQPSTAIRW